LVSRVLDLVVLLLLAAAILIPRPDVKVKPALSADPAARQRIAELQAQLLAAPDNATAALELAHIFMDLRRPEWALASLWGAMDAHPDDHRLHHMASLALADHFEPAHAFIEAQKALNLCEGGSRVPCGEADRGRLTLLQSALERVKHIDMRRDPNSAKAQLIKGLRMTFIPKKTPKAGESDKDQPQPTTPNPGP